ncbi:MAG: hypothetical protein K2X27_04930 [Candidatus Obscuribacterales bacterium]|nr:hypothetical protein [Candidatus Obscuribacterales bacterium]
MDAIGEVLSSSITAFTAESWSENELTDSAKMPQFGSFLKSISESREICVYAVIYDIVRAPIDQHHKPTALKMSRAELKREQPQIFSLLKTEWHTLIIGYKQGNQVQNGLPPFPPEVHDFVAPLDKSELLRLTENLDFLRMLSAISKVPTDEILAASIKNAASARDDEYDYLVEAGQYVSRMLRDDYDRLASVLRKISPSPQS